MRSLVLIALLVATSRVASADANADVTAAFAAFIDGIATGKGSLAGVDIFIIPGKSDINDDGEVVPVDKNHSETKAVIASSKLKTTKVIVSKGGKSAWIAGEVGGKIQRKGKAKTEPVRVSAFLFNDDKGWHVQATHWSTGEPDAKSEMCGMLDEWKLAESVPKDTLANVEAIYKALEGDWLTVGAIKPAKFGKLLSDDKNAFAIGSGPKEAWLGGAKIKGIFKKFNMSAQRHRLETEAGYPARAAMGPDGEMMWVAMSTIAPAEYCTTYRTLFVLAKEKAGWRIVHHHYSQPTNPY